MQLTSAIGGALVVSLAVPPAFAQTPAIYEATPNGRVLACFGQAYALVELLDVATQNLSLLAAEVQRPAASTRPVLAAGLVQVGTQVDQQQSKEVADRLAECSEGAARRATVDAAAAFTAQAVREEIDAAIRMAEGFDSDYQKIAARLQQYFAEATDATAKNAQVRPYSRFGEDVRTALTRGRTAIDQVVTKSAPPRR